MEIDQATKSELHVHAPAANSATAQTELDVTGMTCANCARHVTEALQSVPGVRTALINLDSGQASVRWQTGADSDANSLLKAVKKAGFQASIIQPHAHDHDHENDRGHKCHSEWNATLWVGIAGMVPLMIGEWFFDLGTTPWFRWFSFALASVVQIFCGAQFYRGAWNQFKAGSSNMDTLVALGSTTAYGYSLWVLLTETNGHLYFMEAAAIITLISLGHWIESRVSTKASGALRELMDLAPPIARKLNDDFSETDVPVKELVIGDRVALRPGDRVPTDGTAVEGASVVDESMLTGESAPIEKSAGSQVYAGTVNLSGKLITRVTATGEETALSQIIAAVQRAQASRASIQRLGDKVSNVFVPIIVFIALSAGLWWGLAPGAAHRVHDALAGLLWHAHPPSGLAAAFIIAASVLIIACPCAMGLATPVAIMAGSNAAAKKGILIRDGAALEKAGTITTVLFDKTGTLTTGKPTVVKIWDQPQGALFASSRSGSSPVEAGRQNGLDLNGFTATALAAAAARNSNHPYSQAIAGLMTHNRNIELNDWREVQGSGVQASWKSSTQETHNLQLGSLKWLRECKVELGEGKAALENWASDGASITGLAIDQKLHAFYVVKDTLKPGALDVVDKLRRQGLKVYMVTGDSSIAAAAIASEAGIESENTLSEVRPEQKADVIKKLQAEGQRVAFVGDGINDAPALEQADLGIAVSRASDVARESADIILLKSEIEAVPESLELARATLRAIKQNLFWAFFYNAVGVPLAALGFMSPVLCAAAMGLSDFVVIGNALRLRRK